MGTYNITQPDGSSYEVDADSADEAQSKLNDFIVTNRKADAAKAFGDLPWYQKPAQITDDIVRNVAHGVSAGWLDKGLDYLQGGTQNQAATQAAADRLGGLFTPTSRAAGAMMLPSNVVRAVNAVGGGPIMRGTVGALVGAGEGGAYGTAAGAADPNDTALRGGVTGAVGGGIGQTVADMVRSGVNAGYKAWKGITDVPPSRNLPNLPKNPTFKDRVDQADTLANIKGGVRGTAEGLQAAQKEEYSKLLTLPPSQLTGPRRELVSRVAYGDPGTKIGATGGTALQNPTVAGTVGTVTGLGTGGFTPAALGTGAATTLATMGLGKVAAKDSAAATQGAVDDLRRTLYRQPKYLGILRARPTRKIGQGLGYGTQQGIEDYLGD